MSLVRFSQTHSRNVLTYFHFLYKLPPKSIPLKMSTSIAEPINSQSWWSPVQHQKMLTCTMFSDITQKEPTFSDT